MDKAKFRDLLVENFNLSDIKNLCFDLGINHESIAGDTIEDKTRELIVYCYHQGMLNVLVKRCRELRPYVDWTDFASSEGSTAISLPEMSVPNLRLRMFRPDDRSRLYQENLSFDLSGQPYSWNSDFGLVLENTTPSSIAKHVSIRITISWGEGEQLQKAPLFNSPTSVKEWKAEPKYLVNEYPAVLIFRDVDFVSIYGHPEEWPGFRLTIYESWSGIFRLSYSVSSIEPFTESSGELSIRISHHS